MFGQIVRQHELLGQKSQLEWQLLSITNAISNATKAATDLMQVATDYENDSVIAKNLQVRQYKLKLLEEQLSKQKMEIERKLQETTTELDSLKQKINSEIDFWFKTAA